MIPVRDENPTHHPPLLTITLIVLNVAVFLFQATRSPAENDRLVWKFGFIPAKLTHSAAAFREQLPVNAPRVLTDQYGRVLRDRAGRERYVPNPAIVAPATALPAWIDLLTCMFLHGGWAHLLGNMLFLWVFGNNIEDRLGPPLFLAFYLAAGITGTLAHMGFDRGWMPLIGASGAISGVMGAYIVLYPRARILALAPVGWYLMSVKLPAWIFLGIYIVVQNLFPATFSAGGSVAYWAHIGGFAAGAALIVLLPQRARLHPPPPPVPIDDRDADIVI